MASRIRRFRWSRSSFSVVGLLAWRIVVVRIIVDQGEHIVAVIDRRIGLAVAVAAFAFIALPFIGSFAFVVAFVRRPCLPCPYHRPCRP